jgi:hypothetical protein
LIKSSVGKTQGIPVFLPGPIGRVADLTAAGLDKLVERWDMDLREQFEIWAHMKNKDGFSYTKGKDTKQDYLIFLKNG